MRHLRPFRVAPRALPLLVPLAAALGCAAPVLNSVDPPSGYPRQLLAVDGNTLFASVVWDAGTPGETVLYNGLFGTSYFQIPAGAPAGTHQVALRNSNGTSGTVAVTVLAPSGGFPPPRIESVDIVAHSGTGPIDAALVVTGANLDVDASVTVNGAAPEITTRWGALPVNYLQSHVPATFGYPIYHFTQLLVVARNLGFGSTLGITVTNGDGQAATTTYTLPATAADMDSDGDGLLDSWEEAVYTAPAGGTVDLAALGTRRLRRDILVEVDWIAAATPDPATWTLVESAFRDAPVLNPDGSRGINLIIDRGQGGAYAGGGNILPDHAFIELSCGTIPGCTSIYDYKATHFDAARRDLFHYAVLGRANPNFSGRGEQWGNDFFTAFAEWPVWSQPIAQAGTFLHELGHNLGLTHGGLNSGPQAAETRKPNFATSMSYRWQFFGVSTDCDWVSDGMLTYSVGQYARITESAVNEPAGICDNTPLDMNGDGLLGVVAVDFSLNGNTTGIHDDLNQWGNLLFRFRAPGSAWSGN